MRRARAFAAALLLAVAGCGGEAAGDEGRTVTVFAASSLTGTFTELGSRFEADTPGTRVRFNFGSSAALAQQIVSGAPADVFAAASVPSIEPVVSADAARGGPRVFARNRLAIAVPPGNPQGLGGLADLARPGLKVAMCARQIPCGAAAAEVLALAEVTVSPATLEPDVKATLGKLRLGEVDAALVYRTDITAADADVDGVDFSESTKVVNDYPVLVLADAPEPDGAAAFVDFLLSDRGRAVLTDAGFLPA